MAQFGRWLGVLGRITFGARYTGGRAEGMETMVLDSRFRVWGVRDSGSRPIPEMVSENADFGQHIDFGEVVPFVRWQQEARDDVSILALNLFALRFSSRGGLPSNPPTGPPDAPRPP